MGYLQLCHVSLPEDIVWYCSVNRSIIQWIGLREFLTAKPNDLHGKINRWFPVEIFPSFNGLDLLLNVIISKCYY